MTRKRIAALFIVSTIAAGNLPLPAMADAQSERLVAKDTGISGTTTLNFGSSDPGSGPSTLFTYQKVPGGPGAVDMRNPAICGMEGIEKCAPAGVEFEFRAIFPPCENEYSTNCIDSVWALNDSGVRIEGVMQRQLIAPNRFPGDMTRHIPAGEGSSIWKIPRSNALGSDLFAVVVGQSGSYKDTFSSSRSVISDTFASIQPVDILPWSDSNSKNNSHDIGLCSTNVCTGYDFYSGSYLCEVFDTTICAARESFVSKSRFGIKIRFQELPLNWFRGRLDQPEIMITPSNSSRDIIQVVGGPITVPFVTASAKWSDFSPRLKSLYPGDPEYLRTSFGNAIWGPDESGDNALEYFKEWQPFIKDRASAMKTFWTFHSINFDEAPRPGTLHVYHGTLFACSTGVPLAGFVTTNASVYGNGPPSFNTQTQTLDYKVAAPHFTSEDQVFLGSYDLKINSDVARCLYSFSQAPINASIQVIDETGTARVATSSVSESNGYVNLHVSGFSYSSPILRVKLTQETKSAQSVSLIPRSNGNGLTSTTMAKTPKAIAAKSITCVKGKTIKKVTAVNPKCPVGYKKK